MNRRQPRDYAIPEEDEARTNSRGIFLATAVILGIVALGITAVALSRPAAQEEPEPVSARE